MKVLLAVLVVVLLLIAGLAARIYSHTIYSNRQISLTLEEVEKQCPALIITDDEQLAGTELLANSAVQSVLNDESVATTLDKNVAQEICNTIIPDFAVSDLSAFGRCVYLDGAYNDTRCIFTFTENGTICKTIAGKPELIYENNHNKEFKKHFESINIMESIFGND